MEKAEEQKIIIDCQKGNKEEFGKLYDRYVRKIYDFVYYKTHHKETAEDITSRVFIKALEKIDTFNCDRGFFSAWIYQIARNSVIDFYRTKKGDIGIDDVWDLASIDNIERDIDVRQKLEKVEKYLKELKNDQREIIMLRVWQGMNYKEIAEILDKSEASCKMMFSRAIKDLRKDVPAHLVLYILLYAW